MTGTELLSELRETSTGDWMLGAPLGGPIRHAGALGGAANGSQTLALQDGGGGGGGGDGGGGGGQYRGSGVGQYSKRQAYDIAVLYSKTGVMQAKEIPPPAIRGRQTRCPACKYMGKTVLTREAWDALMKADLRPEAGQLAPHGEWRCGNIAPFIGKWVEDHPSSGMTAAELTIPIDNPLEVYAAHRQMLGLPLE